MTDHDYVEQDHAGRWWYCCDRGRGLFGPFRSRREAVSYQDGHRHRLHGVTVEDERALVRARDAS